MEETLSLRTKVLLVAGLAFFIAIFFAVTLRLDAQNPPVATTLPQKVEAQKSLSAEQKLAIRNAQVEYNQVQLQMTQLAEQYRTLESQKQEKAAALNKAVETVFKQLGLKQEEWVFDKDLNLTPAPKAEKK